MTKKALVIVLMAGVIALSGGVTTYFVTRDGGSDAGKGTDPDPSSVTEYADIDETAPDDAEETSPPEDDPETQAPTEAADTDVNAYSAVLTSSGTYRIRRIYDHTSGTEVTAREVFGKLYSYCSLSFSDDDRFELCINPTSGEIRRGNYQIYGDVISAEYDDGVGSEFSIITDTPGAIDYVLVNYGDYDVYFGIQ